MTDSVTIKINGIALDSVPDEIIKLIKGWAELEVAGRECWSYVDEIEVPEPIATLIPPPGIPPITTEEMIPVDQRLPEPWVDVLFYDKDNGFVVGDLSLRNEWTDGIEGEVCENVTHWLALGPQPPEWWEK